MGMVTLSPMYKLGFKRMEDAIRTGEDLLNVLADMYKLPGASACYQVTSGAIWCLVSSWVSFRESGSVATCRDAAIQSFMDGRPDRISYDVAIGMIDGSTRKYAEAISVLCSAVSQCKRYCVFDLAKFDAAENDGAIAVRLVGSPDRVTTTTVKRDSQMEIVSTTTRQSDVIA